MRDTLFVIHAIRNTQHKLLTSIKDTCTILTQCIIHASNIQHNLMIYLVIHTSNNSTKLATICVTICLHVTRQDRDIIRYTTYLTYNVKKYFLYFISILPICILREGSIIDHLSEYY